MSRDGFALFSTSIGECGVSWRGDALTWIQLPEKDVSETVSRLAEKARAPLRVDPPKGIARAMKLLSSHLGGKSADLSKIALDMSAIPPFAQRVYEAARKLESGSTVSYGELAALAGSPGAARAVGTALSRNPFPIVIPCHRILAANGKPGGFSSYGGLKTKARLLELEGVRSFGNGGPERASPSVKNKTPITAAPGALRSKGDGFPFDRAAALAHLRASDSKLARVIDRVPFTLELERFSSPYVSLAQAIFHQQLTSKAANTILGRVCALSPRGRFPSPEELLALPEASLRGAGLSGAKTAGLRDLAAKSLDGTLPPARQLRRMSDDEIVERLVVIRGIGRWTVEMLLMFKLGRPDVLPVDDYGVRKGFQRVFRTPDLPTRAELAKRGERWAPYRSVASWYLWRALELPD